jgi:hypothetical protein
MQRGGHCCWGHGHRSARSEEGEGRSGWVGGCYCGWMSQGVVKSLIGQLIEVEPLCGLKPTLEIVVLWSICARLCNFVLSGGVETSVKL